MAPARWTTPEQWDWLASRAFGYRDAQKNGGTSSWLVQTCFDWFVEYPEQDVIWGPGNWPKTLTDEDKKHLADRVEARQKVRTHRVSPRHVDAPSQPRYSTYDGANCRDDSKYTRGTTITPRKSFRKSFRREARSHMLSSYHAQKALVRCRGSRSTRSATILPGSSRLSTQSSKFSRPNPARQSPAKFASRSFVGARARLSSLRPPRSRMRSVQRLLKTRNARSPS